MDKRTAVKPVPLCIRVQQVEDWYAYAQANDLDALSACSSTRPSVFAPLSSTTPKGIRSKSSLRQGRAHETFDRHHPNSSQRVTDGVDTAIDPLRAFDTPIRCLTLAEGSLGIESQYQAVLTIAPVLALAAAQEDAAGYVIACFCDPGLYELREQTYLPSLVFKRQP